LFFKNFLKAPADQRDAINSSRPIASTHSPVGSACGITVLAIEKTKTKASFSFLSGSYFKERIV